MFARLVRVLGVAVLIITVTGSIGALTRGASAGGTTPSNPLVFKGQSYGAGDTGGRKSATSSTVGGASVAPGGYDRIGELSQYSFWTQSLTDRLALKVNLESGNLIVEQHDLGLPGVAGFNFSVDRYWNSQWDDTDGAYGLGWVIGTGGDIGFNTMADGSKDVFGPTGWALNFAANGSGVWSAPPGVNADMRTINCSCAVNGDVYLQFHASKTSYIFDANGVLLWVRDRNGNLTSTSSGNQIAFTYVFPSGHPFSAATATDSYGNVTHFTADPSSGLVTQMADPSGRTYKYGYDSGMARHETSYTDPNNKTTTYQYTGNDITKITDALGNQTTFTWDSGNGGDRIATITRVTDNGTGAGQTWTFSYDDVNARTTLTDPNGHATVYTQGNGDGTIVSAKDALNRTVATSYTANGDAASATNEVGATSNNTYSTDGKNNLLQAQGPANAGGQRATSTYTYNDSNNPYAPTSYSDANGHGWQYSYDPSTGNMLTKAEGSSGAGQNPVTFTYNSDGTVATATDARANKWTYSYTNHNLTSVTAPVGSLIGAITATYDSLNRVSCVTDGIHNKTCYAYDNLDRVTTVTTLKPDGTTFSTVLYTYDADGNVTARTDSTGTVNYTYNALNRLIQETKPGPTVVQYGYDGTGNRTSLTDPSGTTTYEYDAADRVTKVSDPISGSGYFTYAYNEDSQGHASSVAITYPTSSGVVVTSSYDASGRLTSIANAKSGTNVATYNYAYTYNGSSGTADGDLRSSMTATEAWPVGPTGSSTTTYGYDTLGRLLSAARTGAGAATYTYSYDKSGNMTSAQTGTGTPTQYYYGPANEVCNKATQTTSLSSCASPWTYTFDADGNQSSGGGFTLGYNPMNQTATDNGEQETYAGLGQSERIGSGPTSFLYDALGLSRRGSTYYTRDPQGTMLGARTTGTASGNQYFLFDGLGSVVGVTDSSGSILAHYTYDPYGVATAYSNGAGTDNRIEYAGYYSNGDGLYKVGARYYNPADRRWTQRDPINNALTSEGWNQYDYAGDDPINMTDPSGECILCSDPLDIKESFVDFGAAATGFIAGESACYMAGVLLAPETGGAALVGAAAVCALGGVVEAHHIHEAILRGQRNASSACRLRLRRCR